MKSLPFLGLAVGFVEPLEARIAPAQVFIGAPDGPLNTAKDTEYIESNPFSPDQPLFVDTSTSTDAISAAVDGIGSGTFYMRLSAGDAVFHFTQANSYEQLIRINSGKVVAFFVDYNGNNDYDDGEFTGLALGQDVEAVVSDKVYGDIVTNLDEHGTTSPGDDTLQMTGLVSAKQGIKRLEVSGGSVFGSIYSGGNIQNLIVAGNVDDVRVGTATNARGFDFFGNKDFGGGSVQLVPGGEGTLNFAAAPKQIGASVLNAKIDSIGNRTSAAEPDLPKPGVIQAGDGGFGAKGGALTNIQITEDTDGLSLITGAGGAGDAASRRANGGAGGDLANIYISEPTDSSPNSVGGIFLKTGDGGDGLNTAHGGAAGKATNVFVGYELRGGSTVTLSAGLTADGVLLQSGVGGDGKQAGAGGLINNVKIRVQTTDVQGNEVAVVGGSGGNSTAPSGGKAGAGASITNVDVRNQILTFDADILLQGGNGGNTVGSAAGAAGGAISNATLLGFDFQTVAGDGSDGKTGGTGGSISNLLALEEGPIIVHNALINAGRGGDATQGKAGNAGNISNLRVLKADIEAFIINSGVQANGGTSFDGGKGGGGGSVTGLDISDTDSGFEITGKFDFRSGNGGDGSKGGGAAGSITTSVVTALNADFAAKAGVGGSATLLGKGGSGGKVDTVQFTSLGKVNDVDVSGQIETGAGGNGTGKNGSGGAGGDARLVNVDVEGSATLIAGNGGNGSLTAGAAKGGAAGKGGAIIISGLFAQLGSGELRAGNAGVIGSKRGAGGSIVGGANGEIVVLRAQHTLTVTAGNGSHGGAGGDVKGLSFGSANILDPDNDNNILTPTPDGSIFVRAGQGSAEGKAAGNGGSIDNVNGSISSGTGMTTRLEAGDGGTGSSLKAGAGGSVTNISLSLGGNTGVVVTVEAGDAGNAESMSTGAKGGDVRNVGMTDIDEDTFVQTIGAGDAGIGKKRGGLGGSIDRISVENHDIGRRTGTVFGYTSAGGLFAGLGGGVSGPGKVGLAGSVTNVNANAIAAIVAGKSLTPQLAEKVENIVLNEQNILAVKNLSFYQVENSQFTLTFGNNTTPLLPGGATKEEVQAALNALPSIKATNAAGTGSVTVDVTGDVGTAAQGYKVVFNSTGDVVQITGVEQVPVEVSETDRGSIDPVGVTETIPGAEVLDVTELVPGARDLVTFETVPGDSPFAARELVRGDVGDPTAVPPIDPADEIQEINLSPLAPYANSRFTLTFTAPDGTSSTTPQLPPNATATQIDAALEALPSIQALGTDPNDPPGTGAVTVDAVGNGVFDITFRVSQDVDTLLGDYLLPESQRIDLGDLPTIIGSEFQLTFGANTTSPLPSTATPAEVEAALNGLGSIIAAGGVKVTGGLSAGIYNVTFNTINDKPQIEGIGLLRESQRVDLDGLPSFPTAVFELTFKTDTTTPLLSSATAAQVDAALEALPSIMALPGPAGDKVTVGAGANNSFTIGFNSNGDQPDIVANAQKPETQTIDIDGLVNAESADFTLAFNGESTARLDNNATAQQVEDALNLLTTIKATGPGNTGTVDVIPGAAPGEFKVTFAAIGDQPSITGTEFVHETQTVDQYAVGNFVIRFGNDSTQPLAPNAPAQQVEDALNSLPAIQLVGGVDVDAGPNSSYRVHFRGDGDIPSTAGTQFEAMLASTSVNGDAGKRENQIVQFVPKGEVEVVPFLNANLVGSIFDINEIDANVFHFLHNGVLTSAAERPFQVGDTPIDGIVMAKVFSQQSVNFIPEAKLTASGFFDNDNII